MIRPLIAMALIAGTVLLGTQSSPGQDFSIDAFSIEALSATSSGEGFILTGSIGEPESDLMTGGEFSLKGGFWAVVTAVQTPGSPRLSVELTEAGNVRIAWPEEYENYKLQQSFTLQIGSWTQVTNAPSAINGRLEVQLVPSGGQHFFRLQQAE
jgi:hypothetical protein